MPLSKVTVCSKTATIPNFSSEHLLIYNHVPFENWECQTHITLTSTFTTCCPGNMFLYSYITACNPLPGLLFSCYLVHFRTIQSLCERNTEAVESQKKGARFAEIDVQYLVSLMMPFWWFNSQSLCLGLLSHDMKSYSIVSSFLPFCC